MYNNYRIGNCLFQIQGEKLAHAVEKLAGFHFFAAAERRTPEFYVILYEGNNIPATGIKLYECNTNRVTTIFYTIPGGHLLEMYHENGYGLYMWSLPDEHTVYLKGNLSVQLVRFALWTGYGLMTVHAHKMAVHSSCIIAGGRAYLFLGESGTGKSTHTGLWKKHIPDTILLNDDSPIVTVEDETIWVYGSPWSGKTHCYKQARYPLYGCIRLVQASHNKISRLPPLHAYASLHPSCPPEFAYDGILYEGISNTIAEVVAHVPFYQLRCRPDREAALLSYTTLSENNHENNSK